VEANRCAHGFVNSTLGFHCRQSNTAFTHMADFQCSDVNPAPGAVRIVL
jgi:hypothetical protein